MFAPWCEFFYGAAILHARSGGSVVNNLLVIETRNTFIVVPGSGKRIHVIAYIIPFYETIIVESIIATSGTVTDKIVVLRKLGASSKTTAYYEEKFVITERRNNN